MNRVERSVVLHLRDRTHRPFSNPIQSNVAFHIPGVASLEKFFGMGTGYVLNFSDRTFQEFIGDSTGLDIDDDKYKNSGTSKASRLRSFIKLESNYTVGLLIEAVAEHAMEKYQPGDEVDDAEFELYQTTLKIATRLKDNSMVEHLDALRPSDNEKDFNRLAKSLRESIEKNEPESALDRLHTFTVKFIRDLCDKS